MSRPAARTETVPLDIPLPWERQLWSGRPTFLLPRPGARRERYVLTDLRLLRVRCGAADELAIHDIGEVHRIQSRVERMLGVSTIEVWPRRPGPTGLVLRGIRRGDQLAALLELLSGDPRVSVDAESARAAIEWEPRLAPAGAREAVASIAAVLIALFAVVIGLHGHNATISYAADDAIYPNGEKRSRAEIVQFMQADVMPWARAALGQIKGGPGRITCDTCHGPHPDSRDWHMPAVAALPKPDVRQRGWEIYSGGMDAQMRNAIYGYAAESDKQAKAAYMREVVMPGMARLLHRPAYDFTQPYEYNRSRLAFGCYHCHMVR